MLTFGSGHHLLHHVEISIAVNISIKPTHTEYSNESTILLAYNSSIGAWKAETQSISDSKNKEVDKVSACVCTDTQRDIEHLSNTNLHLHLLVSNGSPLAAGNTMTEFLRGMKLINGPNSSFTIQPVSSQNLKEDENNAFDCNHLGANTSNMTMQRVEQIPSAICSILTNVSTTGSTQGNNALVLYQLFDGDRFACTWQHNKWISSLQYAITTTVFFDVCSSQEHQLITN